MNDGTSERLPIRRSRLLPVAVIGLTVLVFGVTIYVGTNYLRQEIRKQIKERDAEALHIVVQMLESEEGANVEPEGLAEDPVSQFTVILKASRLKDVMAIRLFDTDGKFYEAIPPTVNEGKLDASDFRQIKELTNTISRYHPAARLADTFLLRPEAPQKHARTAPLLEAIIPLHARDSLRLLGAAQFIIDGQSIHARFAALDQYLLVSASTAFTVGSLIITLAFGWAFRRLQLTNRALEKRTVHLQRANQELVLAAKTSAVGAVTAHLLHGLKNPLSGLQNFVASRAQDDSNRADPEWETAYLSTRRMHTLIMEVVGILRDAQEISTYEVSLAELVEVIKAKALPLARSAQVRFSAELQATGILPSRVANLVMLILVNLIQNAIQATPKGKSAKLILASANGYLRCDVSDEGPGLATHLHETLFTPCQSSKEGGSGIGLAISKQLANHLVAGLELKSSTPNGCVFSLTLPAKLLLNEAAFASPAARA